MILTVWVELRNVRLFSAKECGLESRLDMSLVNDLQEVGRVIDSLEEFGVRNGIPQQQVLRFALALDELITNIISHGFSNSGGGSIGLIVEQRNGVLSAELVDDGPPFDPFAAELEAPTGDIEDRRIGGLGIELVRNVMDEFGYKRDGGFNRVIVEMKLKTA
jgi:anti-sigma regulatory factor (Ser/Thr protein kinase)